MLHQAQNMVLSNVGQRAISYAEIGVYEADYSVKMLKTFNTERAWFVGSWEKTPTQGYAGHSQEEWDAIAERAKLKLASYPNATILHMTSVKAVEFVPDNSLDFVYLDGSHFYERVAEDINLWFPKVKVGGWVTGDDYLYEGVKKAVDEFISNNPQFQLTQPGGHWWFPKHTTEIRSTLRD